MPSYLRRVGSELIKWRMWPEVGGAPFWSIVTRDLRPPINNAFCRLMLPFVRGPVREIVTGGKNRRVRIPRLPACECDLAALRGSLITPR